MTPHRRDIQIELLVLEAQSGNPEALPHLVDRYHQTLTRRAITLTNNPDAASDITQDTWLAIARGIRSLRDPARFHAWSSSILANHARDWIKKQIQQREQQPDPSHAASPSTSTDADATELRHAILSLDPKLRDIIILIHMDRCTIEQAAAALAIPTGTAKSRIRKAKALLRQQLNSERT